MDLANRATNGVATRAEGALAHCGSGSGDFELSYSCQGPSCSSLDGSLQGVACHKDGSSTLICSTDTKCQPGTSSYQSNFTFSQNEPDPWSPTMESKPDVWVPQDQHVMVGGCAKFSLTSDGTKKGTHVVDAENTCPNLQRLSTPGAMAGHLPTSTGPPHVGATQGSTIFAGTSARRSVSTSSLLLILVFAVIIFFPGAQALASHHHPNKFRLSSGAHLRATFSDPRDLAERLVNDLAVKASSQGYNGHAFAIDLVASAVSSVCREGLEESGPRSFDPAVLNSCVASVYGGDQVPQPALRFLAVFGGSILCNYIVSETWANGQDFSPNTCEGLQDLVNALRKDAPTTNHPALAATESPITKPESPGVFFPIASTSGAQNLDQSTSISLKSRTIASLTASLEVSAADITATYAPPPLSALLLSGPTTLSATTDDIFPSKDRLDVSGSASPFRPVPSALLTAAASLAQISGLSNPSSTASMSMDGADSLSPSTPSLPRSDTLVTSPGSVGLPTSLAATTATPSTSQAAGPPNPESLNSLSAESIGTGPPFNAPLPAVSFSAASLFSNEAVDVSSSTPRPFTVGMLAAPNLSFVSSQSNTAQQITSDLPSKSGFLLQDQLSNYGPSRPGQTGMTLSSETTQTVSFQANQDDSLENGTTNAPLQSQTDSSRPSLLSLEQPSSVCSSVTATPLTAVSSPAVSKLSSYRSSRGPTTQAHMSGFSTENNVPESTQWLGAESLASGRESKAAPVQATASGTPQSTVDKTKSLRHSTQSDSASSSTLARSARVELWTSTQDQLPVSVEAVGASTDVLDVAKSTSTGSMTISLTSESQILIPLSLYKVMPAPVTLTTTKPPNTVPAYYSLSGELVSLTPAGLASNNQAVNNSSLAFSNLEVLATINADNAASAVAASFVSFLTTSTPAASRASVAASTPNLASLLPSSYVRSTVAAQLTESSNKPVDGGSELRSESSPSPNSSATILPVGDLSTTAMISTASTSSGSKEKSRSSIPSAELSSNASASTISTSRSSGARVTSRQIELITPVMSVASTTAPGSLTFVSSPRPFAVSHITSKLSQASVTEPSPANTSIPFGSFGSGNSGYSSNELLVPTSVPPTSLPQATAVVTSSNGSSTSVATSSAPTDGSPAITPPEAEFNLTSGSSHTTLDTTRHSNLAALCAQNSSASSFCPGIGCVSLMTNQAHCGACDQACVHVCYQGACVCPDLSSPDEKHGCESKPVPVECENGYYTRNGNGFGVCAPAVWSSTSRTSTPTSTPISNRSSIVRLATPSISSTPPSGSPLLLATVTLVVTIGTEPAGCPPILPDLCDGTCFNTMSEHNHCGGCGNFCSGTCVAGSCLAMSTKASPQLASTSRMVATSDYPTTPTRQTSTATVQPVVAYIWRGLAGPR